LPQGLVHKLPQRPERSLAPGPPRSSAGSVAPGCRIDALYASSDRQLEVVAVVAAAAASRTVFGKGLARTPERRAPLC